MTLQIQMHLHRMKKVNLNNINYEILHNWVAIAYMCPFLGYTFNNFLNGN